MTRYNPCVAFPRWRGERPSVVDLTAEQKTLVQETFGKYDLAQLGPDDAEEIIAVLEDGGLRDSGLRSAVIEAGLNPAEFRRLMILHEEAR